MTELTLGEFKNVLGYLIDNNHRLIDSGDTPISVCLEGEAGLGKTAVVQQLAEEKGMSFVKINLAQLEEPAELVGFPFKEFKIIVNGEERWVPADLLQNMNCDYAVTAESRMSYAVPAWVPRDANPNGTMLVLDDFSRANSMIIQAVMEIINTGAYVSWDLPKYTNIVLTSNPDNGSYTVTGLDDAVKSRMITFNGKFDIHEWARWAEMFGLDGRAINFALLYHTELFEPKNGVLLANARNYTTFCRAIAGIKDWSKEDSLALILEIASGCFLGKDNIIGALFTSFINNRLDKLIEPKRMVLGQWDTISQDIHDCVYYGDQYRADIASILGTRFLNYCDKYLGDKEEAPIEKVTERIDQLVKAANEGNQLFSNDILYTIVKTLCAHHVRLTNRWLLNKGIREVAL